MVKDFPEKKKETCCHHLVGYTLKLAAKDFLFITFNRQDIKPSGLKRMTSKLLLV